MTTFPVYGSAEFSPCGTLRWRLDRWWDDRPRALVCMTNPSKAGADRNDATIWNLIRLMRPLPYCGGFTVVNWEPVIATDPADLRAWRNRLLSSDPDRHAAVCEQNLALIRRLSHDAAIRIVAWGNLVPPGRQSRRVLEALSLNGQRALFAFDTNADGSPKHPLARGRHRIPDGAKPVIWQQRSIAA